VLLPAALVLYSHYSYSSEIVNGATPNAALSGYHWVMTNLLPQQAGLTVNNIFYRYTTEKEREDSMVVYVQNEDTLNEGQYIFRSVDDWTGLPGNTIVKSVPLPELLGSRFGDGSIEVEGSGTVSDATVIYSYRYDPCFNPQSDPSCEGYIPEIPEIPEPEDPLEDEYVQDELDRKAVMRNAEDEEEERESVEKNAEEVDEDFLEARLGLTSAITLETATLPVSALPSTYNLTLPDGVLPSGKPLKDSVNIAQSNRRLQFAQDKMHLDLVKSQYRRNTK